MEFTLYQTLDSVKEALDDLQATERHCVNTHRELTEYDLRERNNARERYKSALTQAIFKMSAELANLDPLKDDMF